VILALHCEYSIIVVLMLLMFLVEQHKVRVEMFLVKANNKVVGRKGRTRENN
jgi:hypothetical protein